MTHFKGHEIREENNDYIEIILHLDTSPNALEEFSTELGHRNQVSSIERDALNYVRTHLPKVPYKKIKVMIGGVLVASILGMTLVVPGAGETRTYAAETTAEVGITGSSLLVSSLTVGGFTAVTLEGITQNTYSNIDSFTVTDPTGSGAGWNIVMEATQFTDKTDTTKTLPTGSLSVAAPTLTALDTGASSAADITKAGGVIDNGTGTTILSAAAGEGMGSYTVSFDPDALTLNLLPKDVKAGTYTSTISVTISSGP